ncbi:alpha/beta fold hydrolase [uncultured Microscilla sp.]|uniref:alpha/beta hydrolase family protein n=1 Tax=uncultured Microscilla sp. TaxID=432653 RepID=UPI00260AFECA|nr:alpha/beta fold hydrolase [uncultured Microscilla sp.]
MKKLNHLHTLLFIACFMATLTIGQAMAQNKAHIEEEVIFKNGEVTLSGTLTLPKAKGRHPAIVLITGSGPQNRDSDILGFKIFKQIADDLTAKGIAVLRYDDRGVGKSTGKLMQSTTEDFAEDVVAAIQLLEKRKDINPQQIGVLGHSEGGIVSHLVYAKHPGLAFMVLMAGPTVAGREVILEQSDAMLKAAGKSDEECKAQRKRSLMMFKAVETGKGWEEVTKANVAYLLEEIKKLPKEKTAHITKPKVYAEYVIKQQLKGVQNPWYKFFIGYDPRPNMEKITCPVLAIFGEKDLQVLTSQNRKPLEKALKKAGNKDVTVKVLKDANHLFQKANTGSPGEYAQLPKKLLPEFLPLVSSWVLKRVKVVK